MSYFLLLPKNLISRGQDVARRRATSAFASSTIEIQSNISTSKLQKSCADLWVEWRCRHVVCVCGVFGGVGVVWSPGSLFVYMQMSLQRNLMWVCDCAKGITYFPHFFHFALVWLLVKLFWSAVPHSCILYVGKLSVKMSEEIPNLRSTGVSSSGFQCIFL